MLNVKSLFANRSQSLFSNVFKLHVEILKFLRDSTAGDFEAIEVRFIEQLDLSMTIVLSSSSHSGELQLSMS